MDDDVGRFSSKRKVGWLAEEGAKGEARDKRREKRETQKNKISFSRKSAETSDSR
jgi:hypothetical protein